MDNQDHRLNHTGQTVELLQEAETAALSQRALRRSVVLRAIIQWNSTLLCDR